MIIGINESAYLVPRDRSARAALFAEWKALGFEGWRPNATLFIPGVCPQTEFEAHLKVCVQHWLETPGREAVICLTNDNYGVEWMVSDAVWREFCESEKNEKGEVDERRARTALISAALRVRYMPVLNWLGGEWRRMVTLMGGIRGRIVWELGNPDLDFWLTDWASPTRLTAKGRALCSLLSASAPADPRDTLNWLWGRTFGFWERMTKAWIKDSAFAYFKKEGLLSVNRSKASFLNFVEVGGAEGSLWQAFDFVRYGGALRCYLYSWRWAAYAWKGWESDWLAVLEGSEKDGEGYANLALRDDELKAVLYRAA